MYTRPIVIRRAAAATGVCLTGLMLAACQGGSTTLAGAGASSAPSTASATTNVTAPAGVSASVSASASDIAGTGSAAGDQCSSSELKAGTSYNPAYNSGSTLIAFIILTNTSNATCTIDGYAGVDFLDPSGKSLGMSTERVAGSNAAPLATQTLAPGKSASEEFTFTFAANDQGNGCVNAGTIAIIPPDQTQALDTKLTNTKTGTIPFFGVCTNSITVFPFAPADQIPG